MVDTLHVFLVIFSQSFVKSLSEILEFFPPPTLTVTLFILFNSIAGLLGNYSLVKFLPQEIYLYSAAVILGVLIGTQLGIKYLMEEGVKKSLGVVLIIAGIKFILT
mgnify:CR=1 FL=1